MDNYQVGQIIFLIGEKTTRVLPIQVVEEVVRTTVDGKIKTYTVKMPDQKETTADINSLKGQLFKDKESLRSHMTSNAKTAIGNMIASAEKLSTEVFEQYSAKVEKSQQALFEVKSTPTFEPLPAPAAPINGIDKDVQLNADNGIIKVDLGNGQFAKMKSSSLDQIKP